MRTQSKEESRLSLQGGPVGTLFSFFAGAGMLDAGLENAGFRTVLANEFHPEFVEGYLHGRRSLGTGEPVFGVLSGSIEELLGDQWQPWLSQRVGAARNMGVPTGFVGGPPCPDFSVAGLQLGRHGERGQLTGVYVELICRQQPDFFVMENVRGLTSGKHKPYLDELRTQLQDGGYQLEMRLCNALEYGVPQDRYRVFLVGFRRASYPGLDLDGVSREHPFWGDHASGTAREIIDQPWPTQDPFVDGGLLPAPQGLTPEMRALTLQHWFDRNDVENHPNAGDRFNVKAAAPRFASIPEGHAKGKSFKRLHRWRYSGTAAYGNNEVHLHPYRPRRLSVAESLAIQSMPAAFSLPDTMSLSAKFKTVGNGVPFLMASGLGKALEYRLALTGSSWVPVAPGAVPVDVVPAGVPDFSEPHEHFPAVGEGDLEAASLPAADAALAETVV